MVHREEKKAWKHWTWWYDDSNQRLARARTAYLALFSATLRANWCMLRLYAEQMGAERRQQEKAFARVREIWTLPYFKAWRATAAEWLEEKRLVK